MMGSVVRILFLILTIVLVIDVTHQREIRIRRFIPADVLDLGNKRTISRLVDPADVKCVQQSNEFAIQLYKQVSAQASDGNVVISPLSIGACLSLAAMGAGGETADEMFAGLRYGKADQKQQVAAWYGRLMQALQNDGFTVVANKLYVKEGYNVKRSFQEMASNSFQSEVEEIHFAQNKIAAEIINNWVESKTMNKIKGLIEANALNNLTRMVLVTSVHFHAKWKHQFEPFDTRPMPFWVSDTESRDVPMMNTYEDFLFQNFETEGFYALELAYSNSYDMMLVLLPHKRDGLAALEEILASLNLVELRNTMPGSVLRVYLPKFKIEFSLDLRDVLITLGMGRMFSDAAEFPDLVESDRPLKVSKAIHKAFIDVNEEGIEAHVAQVTERKILCDERYPKLPIMEFKIDLPFIYVLMSQDKGVYFIGKVTNPA